MNTDNSIEEHGKNPFERHLMENWNDPVKIEISLEVFFEKAFNNSHQDREFLNQIEAYLGECGSSRKDGRVILAISSFYVKIDDWLNFDSGKDAWTHLGHLLDNLQSFTNFEVNLAVSADNKLGIEMKGSDLPNRTPSLTNIQISLN